MSWTKRQFVLEAYSEIGRASYAFDLQPEDLTTGLNRLDGMMALWNGKGIRLGYPVPSSPSGSDLDEVTTVPDWANEAIYLNLAVRLAPGIGKTILPETRMLAKQAYDGLLAKAAFPPEMHLAALPSGAGNKSTCRPFLPGPEAPLTIGNDGELTFD